MVLMKAARKVATISPLSPAGIRSRIIMGYASSGSAASAASMVAGGEDQQRSEDRPRSRAM